MKSTRLALLMLTLACLGGCGKTAGDFCDVAKPHRPSAASVAVMSDAEKREIIAYNEHGERECGWKP